MVVERLTARHARDEFDCGEQSLNQFLRTLARQKAARDLGTTFVAVTAPGDPGVLGYHTLLAGAVAGEAVPERRVAIQRVLPVVRLARLAVDRRHHGEGLGRLLLLDALRRAQSAADTVGAYAVVVDALHERASGFYRHYGFRPFIDDPFHLYMTLRAIRGLGLSPSAWPGG